MSKPNEPAFPQTNEQRYSDPIHGVVRPLDIYGEAPAGLTKRELFAAMAMQGVVQRPPELNTVYDAIRDAPSVAQCSVAFADALLAELAKAEGK